MMQFTQFPKYDYNGGHLGCHLELLKKLNEALSLA